MKDSKIINNQQLEITNLYYYFLSTYNPRKKENSKSKTRNRQFSRSTNRHKTDLNLSPKSSR
jgi:hypothetical protein